jgi:hypothetical protein
VFAVTQRSIASALKVIARADDSSGVIGDAIRRLLDLHPTVAARANTPASKLVEWLITFQFHGDVDYFAVDPVAYAPALGEAGLASYRKKLDEIAATVGPAPTDDRRWTAAHSHTWFTLEWNAQRLAVLDRDVEAIIRTHAKDRRVAAWLEDTAEALAEIGEVDLAIDWAKQATDFDRDHQSLKAAKYWACSSPSTDPTNCSRPSWRCSAAGPPPAARPASTMPPAMPGLLTVTRSSSASRRALATPSCSRS